MGLEPYYLYRQKGMAGNMENVGYAATVSYTHLIDTAAKYYKEYAFHASRETEIKLATLGNSAGMYCLLYTSSGEPLL